MKARRNEILDENGRQLAVVLASNISKAEAARWAKRIVNYGLLVVDFDELTTFCGHDDGSHCDPQCAERNKRVAANRAALRLDACPTDSSDSQGERP